MKRSALRPMTHAEYAGRWRKRFPARLSSARPVGHWTRSRIEGLEIVREAEGINSFLVLRRRR